MTTSTRTRPRRRWQPIRRFSLVLMSLGISSEAVGICGMVLGILAGMSFMATSEELREALFWTLGGGTCVLRILCIQVHRALKHPARDQEAEDVFFEELPERVSDAVTLIGLGFAIESSPWLGLAAALAANFSAYVRSFGAARGADERATRIGPMTRSHRLLLVLVTSVLMAADVSFANLGVTIPQAALGLIIIGCTATVLLRLAKIREA